MEETHIGDGTLVQRFPKSAYEDSSDKRAAELWREDPEGVLAGQCLASVETDPSRDQSSAVVALAVEQPERFRELVGKLPELIQDIFFQHYLLGRTQTQIAEVLGMMQSSSGLMGVSQNLKLGVMGLCAVIAWGGPPAKAEWEATGREKELLEAYRRMERLRGRRGRALEVRSALTGKFVIKTSDPLLEQIFAPEAPDGPVGRGARC